MSCVGAPCRSLAIGVSLLYMSSMALAMPLSLRGMKPSHQTPTTHFAPTETIGENVKVYAPQSSQATASLILLMGYGADLSWTMKQWWYLHPGWAAKDQEWCGDSCVFFDEDKVATEYLRGKLRIVDAVGSIVLAKYSHAWYHYTRWPDGPPIQLELDHAITYVFDLIERERKIVGSYESIAIAGMSQGADLALEVGIRFPHRLGMVVSERGVLHPAQRNHLWKSKNQSLAAGPGTPFILTAGDKDELTNIETYKSDCASLQSMQTPVYFKYYLGLNHGDFSKPEWKLLIDAFTLMTSTDPWTASPGWNSTSSPPPKNWTTGGGIHQIDQLTVWDSCY